MVEVTIVVDGDQLNKIEGEFVSGFVCNKSDENTLNSHSFTCGNVSIGKCIAGMATHCGKQLEEILKDCNKYNLTQVERIINMFSDKFVDFLLDDLLEGESNE